MFNKKYEKGQAIIMIVFAIIGLIGLTALTVDGGRAYMDRRSAQGAADSAAWAGGLANARGEDITVAATNIVNSNGYFDDIVRSEVDVNVAPLSVDPLDSTKLTDGSPNPCPPTSSPNVEITVQITSFVNTFFAPVIGIPQVTNRVQAVTRACGTYVAPIFGGNAIVSCGDTDENYCSFDGGQSGTATWVVHGGGIASDSCAHSKTGNSVTLDEGRCVSGVGAVTGGFSSVCAGTTQPQCTDDYLDAIFPEDPCVSPTPTDIDVIKVEHLSKADLSAMSSYEFTDGIYCIDDLGDNSGQNPLSGEDIILDNATLYIRDMDFDLNFSGGGGFAGTPTISGTYANYSIIVARSPTPCPGTSGTGASSAQVIDYRGGSGGALGTAGLYGTFLAPTACIDMRGNAGSGSDPLVINSQIIANKVSSNGNATITVNYVDNQNRREPVEPTIELVR